MLLKTVTLTALAIGLAHAQERTTYTGCHNHSGDDGTVLYCFGPDGEESARTTYAVSGTATLPATTEVIPTREAQTTAVTDCHAYGSTAIYCFNGAGSEVLVKATPTGETPSTYTDCHAHGGEEIYCVDPAGGDVLVTSESSDHAEGDSDHDHATDTSDAQTTAFTACHRHETDVVCLNREAEEMLVRATPTGELPAQYTGCHSHGEEMYCLDPAGEEVAVVAYGAEAAPEENQSCHFHAGVEHCVGAGGGEGEVDCGLRTRDYNVGLRVGTLFVILVTSAIGVFAPMLLNKIPGVKDTTFALNALMLVKQFGTGIIIATAFIHLYTHAELMFSNQCIPDLGYEGTTSAIVMVGIFLSFIVEYLGLRLVASRAARAPEVAHESHAAQHKGSPSGAPSQESRNVFMAVDHHHGGPNNKLPVMVMEAGILFHSILIGLTLVVAGDSFYRTLLVVIVFHQFFEGLALGARIALLPGAIFPGKFIMAIAFALITPIGMAIGIGVLNTFNGNNPSTVITFGVLDALSAGILVWVGVVDMWARDWVIDGGELLTSSLVKTLVAGLSLCAGMILMGVLGKWA